MQRPDINLVEGEFRDRWCLAGYEVIQGMRRTPDILYGMMLEILRRLYTDENLFNYGDRKVIWCPDPRQTQVWINSEAEWDDELPEFMPAIYVKLGDISYKSYGKLSGEVGVTGITGARNIAREASCSIIFSHIARNKGEAIALANSTHNYMDAFSIVIRDDLLFEVFVINKRKIINPIKNNVTTVFGSDIIFNVQWQENFFIKPERLKLKRIVSHYNSD